MDPGQQKTTHTDYCNLIYDHQYYDVDDDNDYNFNDNYDDQDDQDDDTLFLLATNGSWRTKTSHTSQSVMDYCKQLDHDRDDDLVGI